MRLRRQLVCADYAGDWCFLCDMTTTRDTTLRTSSQARPSSDSMMNRVNADGPEVGSRRVPWADERSSIYIDLLSPLFRTLPFLQHQHLLLPTPSKYQSSKSTIDASHSPAPPHPTSTSSYDTRQLIVRPETDPPERVNKGCWQCCVCLAAANEMGEDGCPNCIDNQERLDPTWECHMKCPYVTLALILAPESGSKSLHGPG